MSASAAKERLAKLQEMSWYGRSDRIAKSGWATMPSTAVAILCASRWAAKPGALQRLTLA